MATKAIKLIQNALIRPYTVDTAQQATVGMAVKFGSSDSTVQQAGANDDAIGICRANPLATGTPPVCAAGTAVEVTLFFYAVEQVLVGTGGSTRGKKQVMTTNGVTDAPATGGGTVAHETIGVALQSGVQGDIIGMGLLVSSRVSAT
jgi:hypothetical protein